MGEDGKGPEFEWERKKGEISREGRREREGETKRLACLR